MKKLVQVLCVLLLLPAWLFAQGKVAASEIIAKINRGEAVTYQNVEVTGDLDLTKLANMKLQKDGQHDDDNNSKNYLSTVTVPLSFTGCTFNGNVLAYFNPDNTDTGDGIVSNVLKSVNGTMRNEVYNTNFQKDVRFEKCVFEKQSAFKYSEFAGGVSFAGSRFQKAGLFKYAKFAAASDFSGAKFEDGAVFKYVNFPAVVNFSNVLFEEEADFKYTKFRKGANFQRAIFDGLANFKYTEFAEPLTLKGAAFKGSEDFKYTKVGGRNIGSEYFRERTK